jgi:DNA-binding MarR family transcriptional regulator
LVTVEETENISEAARQLGLSQPTVSRHLQALAEWSGHTLIDPGAISDPSDPRISVGLTEEGRALADVAREALGRLNAMRSEKALRSELCAGLERIISKMNKEVHSGNFPQLNEKYSSSLASISLTYRHISELGSIKILNDLYKSAKGLFNIFEVDLNKQREELPAIATPNATYNSPKKPSISAKHIRVP